MASLASRLHVIVKAVAVAAVLTSRLVVISWLFGLPGLNDLSRGAIGRANRFRNDSSDETALVRENVAA